jgi:hypothetical protein
LLARYLLCFPGSWQTLTQEDLKLLHLVKQREKVEAVSEAALLKGQEGAAQLVDVGWDALATVLDAAKGKSVQDQLMIRKHAAK